MNPNSSHTFPENALFIEKILKRAQHDTVLKKNIKSSDTYKNAIKIAFGAYKKVVYSNANKTTPIAARTVHSHRIAFFNVCQSHIDVFVA